MEIIIGKSKTGKSKYIYEKIIKEVKKDNPVILFVPSQSRVLAEECYMKYLDIPGVIGVNITTIGTYITEKVKAYNLHLSDKYVSKLDKKIILTQVISENKEIFKVFGKVKSKDGFLDILNIYMDLLRKSDIKIEENLNIAFNDKILEAKVKEIFNIYIKYIEKLNERFIDQVDEVDMYVNEVLGLENLKNVKIFFDGYNNFTKSELRFIENILKKGAKCTISLTTDVTSIEDIYSNSTSSIFEVANTTYITLLKILNDLGLDVNTKVLYENHSSANKDLIYLADNIFEEGEKEKRVPLENVEIKLENNMYTEVENIAKKISELVRSKGARYRDFCIYTTSVDSYEPLFRRVFFEYDIPVYIPNTKTIATSKLAKYILCYLDNLANGINVDKVLTLLKLGLTNIASEDINYLENYLLEFNISKYSLTREFKLNNKNWNEIIYDLERLNKTRKAILELFPEEFNNKKNAYERIKLLYIHLNENLIFKNYQAYLSELETKKEAYAINSYNVESQSIEIINEIFEAINKIYLNNDLTSEQLYNIFKISIKDMEIKTIPPTKDSINIVDINTSKVGMKPYAFFIGVCENSFPKKINEDIIFGDIELNKLKEKEIVFRESTLSKINMGLYNIYEALNNIEKKLYISIPASDISGKSFRKSSFFTLVEKVAKIEIIGSVVENDDKVDYTKIYSKAKMFSTIVQKRYKMEKENCKIEDKQIINDLYTYFYNDEKYRKILDYTKDDSSLDKEILNKIYGDILNTSVSKLELFKKCPFSYFMEYVLNIKERKEFNITSLEIGSFMHNVLEKFSKYLLQNGISWQMILNLGETLEEKYQLILNDIISMELESSLGKHKENIKFLILRQKLENTMSKVVVIIAKGFNQSEFKPFGYEIEFRENKLFAPIKIDLGNGKSVVLVGKIDRVDTLEQDDGKLYVRIVDYKSSSKTLNLDDIKEGLSLQLVTYLTSFIENLKEGEKYDEVIPAAMLYFNLSNNIVNLKDYIDDSEKIEAEVIKALRMKGIFLKDIKIIEKMDKKLNDTSKRLIDISKVSLNPQKKNSKAIEKEEFDILCKEAKCTLKNISSEVLSGIVKIDPNKKANHCKYCKFSTICRKDSCL